MILEKVTHFTKDWKWHNFVKLREVCVNGFDFMVGFIKFVPWLYTNYRIEQYVCPPNLMSFIDIDFETSIPASFNC